MAHSDEVKAQVMAALLSGDGVSEVARKLNLPKTTVHRIKSEISSEKLEQVQTEKRERIDDLLLDTMSANLSALSRIARASSEPSYIKTQPAESVAVLYREVASTTIRLLEAASAAGIGEAEVSEAD